MNSSLYNSMLEQTSLGQQQPPHPHQQQQQQQHPDFLLRKSNCGAFGSVNSVMSNGSSHPQQQQQQPQQQPQPQQQQHMSLRDHAGGGGGGGSSSNQSSPQSGSGSGSSGSRQHVTTSSPPGIIKLLIYGYCRLSIHEIVLLGKLFIVQIVISSLVKESDMYIWLEKRF